MGKRKQVVSVKLKGDEKGTKSTKLQFLVRDVIFYMGERGFMVPWYILNAIGFIGILSAVYCTYPCSKGVRSRAGDGGEGCREGGGGPVAGYSGTWVGGSDGDCITV